MRHTNQLIQAIRKKIVKQKLKKSKLIKKNWKSLIKKIMWGLNQDQEEYTK